MIDRKAQDYGSAAKHATSNLVFRKLVMVDSIARDRYRRTIAEVSLQDGRSLNSELVRTGFAWQYTKYSKDASLRGLEEEAKTNHRGLWEAPNPVPPWEFRKKPRKLRDNSLDN